MTGASSICLFMAAWEESLTFTGDAQRQQWQPRVQRLGRKSGQFLHVIGMACLLWFWMAPITWQESAPFGLEDWYLFPPLMAGLPVVVFLYLIRDLVLQQGMYRGHALFILGVILATGSIVMDRPLCHRLGTVMFLDAFTASNGVFLACDLCFLGIYYVLSDAAAGRHKLITKKTR
jgi:hypothetical protein